MEISPLVRRAKPEDSLRIWEIRNSPAAKQGSINTDDVPWENHQPWFQQKYLENENNACFVLGHDGKVVGYCRFDLENSSFRVSIALDSTLHGMGLGSLFLGEASAQFGKDKTLLAEVKKGNESSVRIFKKNGFHITGEDDKYLYFERRAQ